MTAWPLRLKRVVRPRSNISISVASRMPNKVFSSVTVSPTLSARVCASVIGMSSTWWVIRRASLERDAARRDDGAGAPRRMALDVHRHRIHGDVGGGDLDMDAERC